MLFAALALPVSVRAEETESAVEEMADDAEGVAKSSDLFIVPIPQLDPALGFGVTLAALAIYKVDEAEPEWTTGGGAMLTTNGSKAVGAYHSMSLGRDRIRISALGGYGSFNTTYYGTGEDSSEDKPVDLNQKGAVAAVRGLFEVRGGLYVGARAQYLSIKTTSRDDDTGAPDPDIPEEALDTQVVAIGPALQYDTRDSRFVPKSGVFVDSLWSFSLPALGSDLDYSKFTLSGATYLAMPGDGVLAARVTVCGAAGDVPFFGLCLYGKDAALRGYEAGRYRDRFSSTAQVEYRAPIKGKLGFVIFGGVGTSGSEFLDFGSGRFLPAIGAGLRFRLSELTGMNVGVDAAVGKGDHGIYLTVGEAF